WCTRQQDLRHRFDCVAAHANRHGGGWQAGFGPAINRAGTLALVANRAEDSVTVLAIDGKNVKPVGTVAVATQPTPAVAAPPPALPVAVALPPDGKRALLVKSGANRVGLLDID